MTAACVSKGLPPRLPYEPPEIASFEARGIGVELPFPTGSGMQSAFYIPAKNADHGLMRQLVVIYPGWLSRALDWLEFIDKVPDSATAFLLIDYPGYGNCQGKLNPGILYQTSWGAFKALAGHLSVPRDELLEKSVLLGHSFGCAAALQFAVQANVERLVLAAPFTTLHRMAFRQYGPLGWLIPWGMNNKKRIKTLSRRQPRPAITIIHGTADRVAPLKMGRELANFFPGWIRMIEIPGGGHEDIFVTSPGIIFKALKAGKKKTR